jgi:hypothetical protein
LDQITRYLLVNITYDFLQNDDLTKHSNLSTNLFVR